MKWEGYYLEDFFIKFVLKSKKNKKS